MHKLNKMIFKIKTHKNLLYSIRALTITVGILNLVSFISFYYLLVTIFRLLSVESFELLLNTEYFNNEVLKIKISGILLLVLFILLVIILFINHFFLIYVNLNKIKKINFWSIAFILPMGLWNLYYGLFFNNWKPLNPNEKVNWKIVLPKFKSNNNDVLVNQKTNKVSFNNSKIIQNKSTIHMKLIDFVVQSIKKLEKNRPQDLKKLLKNIFGENDYKKIDFNKVPKIQLIIFKALYKWTPNQNYDLIDFKTHWFDNNFFDFSIRNPNNNLNKKYLHSFIIRDSENMNYEELYNLKKFIKENKQEANSFIITLFTDKLIKNFTNKIRS